jgi:hypothetical protein
MEKEGNQSFQTPRLYYFRIMTTSGGTAKQDRKSMMDEHRGKIKWTSLIREKSHAIYFITGSFSFVQINMWFDNFNCLEDRVN